MVTSVLRLQAEERNEKKRQEMLRIVGSELAEIQYVATSDLLTERPDAAKRMTQSAEGSRVLPDRWKGMTPRQLSDIQRQRERQRFDKEVQILHSHLSHHCTYYLFLWS